MLKINLTLDLMGVAFYLPFVAHLVFAAMSSVSQPRGTDQTPSNDWSFLIERAKDGCDDSFQELFERVYDYLILVADSRINGKMKGKFGASDIVQQGLAKAHSSLDDFQGDGENQLRAWLKSVIVNGVLNESRHFKTQKREVKRECSLADEVLLEKLTPSEIALRNEEQTLLRDYLSRLPAIEQRVLEMRHRFGYKFSEIASFLNISESSARRNFERGLVSLKNWFQREEQIDKRSDQVKE